MTRKSRREIERELRDLTVRDIPKAGLTTIFAAEGIEPVDPDQRLYRIDGEVMRVHPSILETGEIST